MGMPWQFYKTLPVGLLPVADVHDWLLCDYAMAYL